MFFLPAVFQSKDIGIQMHEELVKVTNELYTVSNILCLLQIDASHLISSPSSSTYFPSLCLSDILFHTHSLLFSFIALLFSLYVLNYLGFPLLNESLFSFERFAQV